uniref:Gypsy retrotransposon integrase-like protein 1 n=2 Tax=Nothobranchius rachovii TaxID=451742 RepID=A0A1A8PLB6_9TELE
MRVIAYASRGLSRCETRYPAHKLEFLALKWAVTEKFCDYLYGSPFTVITDSNPLTYLLTTAKLDATSYRWLSALSSFEFQLQYRAGKQNIDADSLSRRPHPEPVNDHVSLKEQERICQFVKHHLPGTDPGVSVSYDVVSAICEKHIISQPLGSDDSASTCPFVTSLSMSTQAIPDSFEQCGSFPTVPSISEEELRQSQRNDPAIREIITRLETDRTLDLVRTRFFWPKMSLDVEQKIKMCQRCVCRKTLPEKAAPLVSIQVTRPLELLCIDFLTIEPDCSNIKDVLVMTDFFTKYAVAVPTSNQKARTVAKALWENFIIHYGFPEKIHSDQGADFESGTIKELCNFAGIQKVRTTPYHPRGNPVERFNRTLLNMLGTLRDEDKRHWHDYVKPLVHAYNCTKHESTGYTPYELMFGRQPRLPVDLAFNVPLNQRQQQSHSQYVTALKTQLRESYKLATENAAKMAERNKVRYDKHLTESLLDVGDRVLVRNVRLRGKNKLADRWDSTVHVVVSQKANLPVYTVKPENQSGPARTLHRDLLLPCGFLPTLPETSPAVQDKPHRPNTRKHPGADSDPAFAHTMEEDDSYSIHYSAGPLKEISRTFEEYRVVNHSNPCHSVEPKCSGNSVPEGLNLPETVILPDYDIQNDYNQTAENDKRPDFEILPNSENEIGNDLTKKNLPKTENFPASETEGEITRSSTEVEESTDHNKDDKNDPGTEQSVRRSHRERKMPKQLTYPQLGNPLISIVQSLFQSLSDAVIDSIELHEVKVV